MPLLGTPKVARCPSCSKPISIQATSCVHCGHPLKHGELEASAAKDNRTAVWVAVVAVVLVLAYTAWVVVVKTALPTPAPALTQNAAIATAPPLELLASRGTRTDNYLTVEGQVRNTSSEKLESIWVVVETFDEVGQFVTTQDGVIDYTPLLPGQTSPFKVMVRNNPAIRRFQVSFKKLFGGNIPHTDLTSPPAPATKKKK